MIRSVLVIGLAIAFFASGTNRPVLANLIGTYWLVGALLTLAWARTNRGARGSRVAVAAGVVGVAAAAILLARSLIQDVISLQTHYAQSQMQTYALQAQELGRLMAESVKKP